jgi:hypothetical protein
LAFRGIGTADLNGDGNADVLVTRALFTNPQPTPITILAGDGKGHFTDRTAQIVDGAVPSPIGPRRTVFADFNGDGRPDVFIADTGLDAQPFPGYPNTLLLSEPGGRLVDASANLPRAPDYTHSAAAADVDGNGTVDLYAGNLSFPFVGTRVGPQILLNDGTGRFRVSDGALPDDPVVPGAQHYDGAGFADVNGDRAPDLVLVGSSNGANRLLLNDGHGRFHDLPGALPAKPWGLDSEGLIVTPLDVNSDGRVDLLLGYTQSRPSYVGHRIQVLVNNGSGVFSDETDARLPQPDSGSAWPVTIQVADINNDGKPDLGLEVPMLMGEGPSFYVNRGNGTFAPLPAAAIGSPAATFLFLDANRDGRVDVYFAKPENGSEYHYLSVQASPKATPKPKKKPKCKPKPHHKRCP